MQSHYSQRTLQIKVEHLTSIGHKKHLKPHKHRNHLNLQVESMNCRGVGLVYFTKTEAVKPPACSEDEPLSTLLHR